MDSSNKENIENMKSSTRIPVPLDPLPPLPKHLLNAKNPSSLRPRQPLTMISNENIPGPSHGNVTHRNKGRLVIDAKHVTVRPKNERSRLKLNFIHYNPSTTSDDLSVEEFCYFIESTEGNDSMTITPGVKSPILEPGRVKNIKQSLKRPHSRELQGISPLDVSDNSRQEKVARQLPFNSGLQEIREAPDYLRKLYAKCMSADYTTDIFSYLIEIEKKPLDIPIIQSITRACIINWIMKVNGTDGNPAVVQAACWYLDSILGTMHVQLDKLQLIAAACYWIAQKLNGPVFTARRLVKFGNQAFSPENLLATEKLVLQNLDFPSQPVVPQDFINYLAWCCNNEYPEEIEIGATFLCMSALLVDKTLCHEYPSVIAAASVHSALLLLRKKDLVNRLEVVPEYQTAQTKATDIKHTYSVLVEAVCLVASRHFEYKSPYEHYGYPPLYIAQRIVETASQIDRSPH